MKTSIQRLVATFLIQRYAIGIEYNPTFLQCANQESMGSMELSNGDRVQDIHGSG